MRDCKRHWRHWHRHRNSSGLIRSCQEYSVFFWGEEECIPYSYTWLFPKSFHSTHSANFNRANWLLVTCQKPDWAFSFMNICIIKHRSCALLCGTKLELKSIHNSAPSSSSSSSSSFSPLSFHAVCGASKCLNVRFHWKRQRDCNYMTQWWWVYWLVASSTVSTGMELKRLHVQCRE